MKRIIFFGVFLIIGILKVNAQCSINTSIINNGNGNITVDYHAIAPIGWQTGVNSNYYHDYQTWDYQGDGYNYCNVLDSAYTHQYYANDTFIVATSVNSYNPSDTSQYCWVVTYDTVIVQDFSCAINIRDISYNPQNGGSSASSFYAHYYSGTSNVYCNWYIQDGLGNFIYTNSGLNLDGFLYTFTQNGTYTVSFAVHAIDTVLNTQCSDSSSIVVNRNNISSCGLLVSLQQQNLQGNSVKLIAHYNGTYSNRYFKIEGNYFYNTDSVIYTFSSGGFHQVGFYGENTLNNVTCRDSITPGIPVGGMPGNCNAAFTLWEDSTNVGQWYAINNSTGFGPPNYLWDFGDGSTSNLAYPTHTYAVPGNYVICLTVSDNYGCSSTMCDSTSGMRISQQQAINSLMGSLTVMAPQVGIAETKIIVDGIRLFPNPMLDLTTIEFNSTMSSIAKVEVVNILGSVVSSDDLLISKGNNELKINTSTLESGIYVINVISESGVIARVKALK